MRFSEERPNDADTVEVLFHGDRWCKMVYSDLGYIDQGDEDHDCIWVDESPGADLEWRYIEGEDMSGLLEGLPDKRKPDPLYYLVKADDPEALNEFLGQFGASLMRFADDGLFIKNGELYTIEMPIREDQSSAWAAYIIQLVLYLKMGWDIVGMEE